MIFPDEINAAATRHNLDPNLIVAFILTESGGDPWAIRYEPNWKWFLKPNYWALRMNISDKTERSLQMHSWGLMQIMGTTARELGFDQQIPKLCIPKNGIEFGCRYFKKQLIRYSGDVEFAISAYNMGTARKNSHGFRNQIYVNKIMNNWRTSDE